MLSLATIALIEEILSLVAAGAGQLPAVIEAANTAGQFLSAKTDPTAEQEATVRAALDAANQALQAS